MACGGFKDLSRRIVSSHVLCDEVSNIRKKLKLDGYQRVLVSTVYNFFEKKYSDANTSDGDFTCKRSDTLATQLNLLYKVKFGNSH